MGNQCCMQASAAWVRHNTNRQDHAEGEVPGHMLVPASAKACRGLAVDAGKLLMYWTTQVSSTGIGEGHCFALQ